MANEQAANKSEFTEPGTSIIFVPNEQVDAIMEFLAGLEANDEEDVRGHMIGGPISGSGIGSMTGNTRTGASAVHAMDVSSTDTDVHV